MIQSIEAKVWVSARTMREGPARRRSRADTAGSRRVLTARAAVVQDGDERPDDEVEDRPGQEERHVEEWRFPLEQRIVLGRTGVRPFVEIVQAEEHRQRQRRHHGERGEDRLADPPQHDPPSALGRVLDSREKERAEGEAQEEQERHEPREEELLRIGRSKNRAGHAAQHGHAGGNGRNPVPCVPRRNSEGVGFDSCIAVYSKGQDPRVETQDVTSRGQRCRESRSDPLLLRLQQLDAPRTEAL